MIGIMAYNLGAWVAKKGDTTIEALRDLLENLWVQEVEDGNLRYWQRTELDAQQRVLFLKLGFDVPPVRFTTSLAGASSAASGVTIETAPEGALPQRVADKEVAAVSPEGGS